MALGSGRRDGGGRFYLSPRGGFCDFTAGTRATPICSDPRGRTMNDATFDADPPEKPKRKPGARRFKKDERMEAVRKVAALIETMVKPWDVVRWAAKEYGITTRAAWDLVKDARDLLAAFTGRPRKQLRIEVAAFFTKVIADPTASYGDRMAAASHFAKLLGLYPPKRVVKADVPASDMPDFEDMSRRRQEM